MKNQETIAVRLNPQLEAEGRGLCDPVDPRNAEVIARSAYGAKGYMLVHPSGFIQAQIASGTLIRVEQKAPTTGRDRKGPSGKQARKGAGATRPKR